MTATSMPGQKAHPLRGRGEDGAGGQVEKYVEFGARASLAVGAAAEWAYASRMATTAAVR